MCLERPKKKMPVIKNLSVKGFKSFAHKTELPFGDGFNMFIGANGSGKSNVCDAICFVLGKSSAKEMRAEKSSNLIFNGGKKGKAAGEAEVAITFDNTSGLFPSQAKELTLTRTVKHNGTSIYKINNDVHTRQQARDLLAAARVDPDGHNIILQGDVIHFMEMKPVERRMIIDQISGISAYDEKKQKCLLEFTKVDTKLNEAEIILKERETNLRELKKDRDQAVQYKDLERDIKNDKATHVHLNMKTKEDHLADVERRKKDAESKISQAHEALTGTRQKIAVLKNEIAAITQELDAKGEQEQLVLRKHLEELKESTIKATSRLELVTTELEKIKSRKTSLQQDMITIHNHINDFYTQKKTLEHKQKQLHRDKTTLETTISQYKEKHGFDKDASQTLTALEREIDAIQTTMTTLTTQKQDLLRKHDQLTYKIQACDERLTALTGTDARAEADHLKKHRARLKEIELSVSQATNEDSALARQLAQARHESQTLTSDLAKLKGRHLTILERQTGESAIKHFLDKKTGIKGIYGTVASLGTVDSKYALALEVAAGGRLQSIVVDTDATAQKCIQHLKDHKIGIATFLPLTTVKARAIDEHTKKLLTEKTTHGLALDLVSFDKKFANVFSYVLGSTLVIENLDTARRIGIGRARMVTITGDLLEPSGAMIGGYRSRTGIGFEEKDTTERVTTLENDLAKTHTLIDHLEHKRLTNEETLRTLRTEKAEIEGAIITLEKSLNINGADTTALADEKNHHLTERVALDKELTTIDQTTRKHLTTLETLKTKRAKVRDALAAPEISKTLEQYETQRTTLTEELATVTSQLKSLDIQHTTILHPELDKAEKIIKQHDNDHETFQHEERDLKELLKKRGQELKNKEAEERKFYTNLKDLAGKRAKLTEKIQTLETSIARDDERQRSHEQRLNSITIERAKIVAELEALQHEFAQYPDAKIGRGLSIDELSARISQAERDFAKIGNVNLRALEVYEDIQKEHATLVEKTETIKHEKEDVLKIMHEVESKKAEIFMKTYTIIVNNFKTIFANLTTKGEAHVELENPEDPFSGGMDIHVKIAHNKTLDMKSLSGGEKTLAALAFIFAIQEYAPSPFYLLDEVDAALDKKNSALLSKLIQQYAKKAQYLVVSHNDAVITEADQIYGVSMQDGISKVVSLKV